jgi:hypothetical protein
MSLAAVPVYLIARRVLTAPLALAAAGLALALPSLLYTGTLMTENAFYAAFLLAALALVACLQRPTVANQLLLLGAVALAYGVRAQALALVPAVVTAPLILAWAGRRGWRSLGAYRVLWAVLGGGLVLFGAVQLARGGSPKAVLGAYETAGHQHYAVGAVAKWLLYHVAELDLYSGLVPFAALLVLAVLVRRLDAPAQAFVSATLALTFWLLLEVAAFASLPTVERIEERNMFYVVPLLLIALLVWIERDAPRPPAVVVPVLFACVVLPALIPYRTLIGVSAQSDTLMLLPWWWLQDHVISLGQVWFVVLLCAAAVALAFLLVPRRLALVLPAFVLVYFAVTAAPIENGRHGIRMASLGALFQGITAPHVDWVDRAVGRHAPVAFLWSGRQDPFTLWQNEFFNRSVGRVYELANPLGGGLPATRVHEDRAGFVRNRSGRVVRAGYVLTDGSLGLLGHVRASDDRKGTQLLRVDGPLRIGNVIRGLYPGDTWSRGRVEFLRRECAGGSVDVQLLGDGRLFPRGQFVTARSGSRVVRVRVPPGATTTATVPLVPIRGRCRATFDVSPTAVPAERIPGSRDRRRLGLHFLSFAYREPR